MFKGKFFIGRSPLRYLFLNDEQAGQAENMSPKMDSGTNKLGVCVSSNTLISVMIRLFQGEIYIAGDYIMFGTYLCGGQLPATA